MRFPDTSIWLDIKLVPLMADGAVYAIMGIARDITERKTAEALSRAADRINRAISSTLDFDRIMRTVARQAAQAISAESAVILLREADFWVARYLYALPEEHIGTRFTDSQARATMLAIETRRPVVVNDAFNDPRVDREIMRKYNPSSTVSRQIRPSRFIKPQLDKLAGPDFAKIL